MSCCNLVTVSEAREMLIVVGRVGVFMDEVYAKTPIEEDGAGGILRGSRHLSQTLASVRPAVAPVFAHVLL